MRHPETSARQVSVPQTSVSLAALLRPVTGTQAPANGAQPLAAAQQVPEVQQVPEAAPEHALPPGQYLGRSPLGQTGTFFRQPEPAQTRDF